LISDLILIDLENILEWFDKIPVESKHDDKFQRTQEKVRGLYNIHEDLAEPLLKNLISATLSTLELHSKEELKSAKSLLLNRKTRLEEHSKQIEKANMVNRTVITSEIDSLQKQLAVFSAKDNETRKATAVEVSKIISALSKIDERLGEP